MSSIEAACTVKRYSGNAPLQFRLAVTTSLSSLRQNETLYIPPLPYRFIPTSSVSEYASQSNSFIRSKRTDSRGFRTFFKRTFLYLFTKGSLLRRNTASEIVTTTKVTRYSRKCVRLSAKCAKPPSTNNAENESRTTSIEAAPNCLSSALKLSHIEAICIFQRNAFLILARDLFPYCW